MKYLFLVCAWGLAMWAQAQPWVRMMEDPDVNFYEVQQAFEDAWGDRGYERGLGYKQFKRWEYFTEQRVYPSGDRRLAEEFWEGWRQAQAVPGRQAKDNQPWEPVGPIQWESQGWNPGLGRVNAVVVDPVDPTKIYVATPSGGLWVHENQTWTSLTDQLPSIGASGLAIDPTNTDILYLATGDGDGSDTYSIGVMKSTDGGQTWDETGLTMGVAAGERMSRIVMVPGNSSELWVAGSMGLYHTTDGGANWQQMLSGEVRDFELKPDDPSVIYAAGNTSFRYSTDGGQTFEPATGLPASSAVNRYSVAVTPANPNLVYLLAGKSSDSGFLGLYRSEDAGQSFELMSDSPNIFTYSEIGEGEGGQSWYDMALAASPTDENYIVAGGINVWSSSDGGATWDIKSHWVHPSSWGYTHADIHSLDFYGDELYCGSDGGVFHSSDNGDNWTDLSVGLQISQYYRIAVSTTDSDRILVGSQDNGTNLFGAGDSYIHLLGGDGNAAAMDYTNDDILYAAYPGGNFQRSTDGGYSFYDFTSSIPESGAWVTPFELHPTQPSNAYAAYENVYEYDQGSWEMLGDLPTTTTLRALEVAPADPSVIYTATFGNLYRTTAGTEEWTPIYMGLPNLYISDIETDPENADRVWVTFSGYDAEHKVYQSEDGGDTWINITENLPNLPVNCISYLQGSDDGLYVGTDNGVFYHSNAAPNWSSYNEGLPNVIVNQILFHYGDQKIIVATYGRGVWRNDFFDSSNLEPTANFTADKILICSGDSVSFTNLSVNAPSASHWQFEGAVVGSSDEYSPTVTYDTTGKFDVMLVASNGDLTDTLVLEDYIHVLAQPGEPTPFYEDFESPLASGPWMVLENVAPIGWEQTDVGYLSDQSIRVDNYSNPSDEISIIESQTFDLSALDTALITMRVAYAQKPDMGIETLKMFISTDCGESWSFKKLFMSFSQLPSAETTADPFVPTSAEDWNLLVIDNIAPEERTSNLRIRLEFDPAGGNNIYVDDINIVEDITVDARNPIGFDFSSEVIPNPASKRAELHFTLPRVADIEVRVLDATGKIVYRLDGGRRAAGDQRIELPLSSLSSGIYFVEMASDLGRGIRKLVIDRD